MGDFISKALPWIGTALGGPLGGGVATFVANALGLSDSTQATVKDTLTNMLGNPEQVAKLKEIELSYQAHCLDLGYKSIKDLEELNSNVLIEVNKTIQAEAASEHWPSYSWRPFIGFSFGFYINSTWILPLFKVTPIVLSPDLVLAIGGILGVASWFRGKMQADPTIPTINKG